MFKIHQMGLFQRKGSDYQDPLMDGNDAGKTSRVRVQTSTRSCMLSAITFLQFAFLLYATFLLYYMSSSVHQHNDPESHNGPESSWTARITQQAQQWKQFIMPPYKTHHQHNDPELHNGPESSWAARITQQAQQWKQFIMPPYKPQENAVALTPADVCEQEQVAFEQKKSNDTATIKLKRELYDEVLTFQKKSFGSETLGELMRMKSRWGLKGPNVPKVTVILNHFKRKTLCAQLDSLLHQTLPFHHVWVTSFGSPMELTLERIVSSYNNSRISFISSGYDFKYYGRFQMALQTGSDFVYIIDDDMIPGRRMLEILSHVGGTEKYKNSVLGSIGRILPFRQKDFSFPSYRKFRSREAGLYLPDPAYDIVVERIVQVDFLSSSWFLSADLVKTLFVETPFTFGTGEDLHLSYQLQKYRDAGSYVLPVDPKDEATWGDSDHRLAYVSETTVIFKDVVQVRDAQWWRAFSSGYVTQWAAMYPQKIDALFYAHSIQEVKALAPLLEKFRATARRKAYIAVSGGSFCPCEEAADALKWPRAVCRESDEI